MYKNTNPKNNGCQNTKTFVSPKLINVSFKFWLHNVFNNKQLNKIQCVLKSNNTIQYINNKFENTKSVSNWYGSNNEKK